MKPTPAKAARAGGTGGWRLAAAAVLAALAAGCVTEVIDVPGQTLATLVVSRSGEEVLGSWNAERGMYYTVLCAAARSARSPWTVLPGYDMLPGTGSRMTLRDRVPLGENRYYRLHISTRPLPRKQSVVPAPAVPAPRRSRR